jgi:hypothetical protein
MRGSNAGEPGPYDSSLFVIFRFKKIDTANPHPAFFSDQAYSSNSSPRISVTIEKKPEKRGGPVVEGDRAARERR